MKIKNNQDGVAHLAAILAIVVVVAIGVVGWKVWDSRTNKTTSPPAKANTQTVKKTIEKEVVIPSDWQWFTSQDGSVKFAYPKTWGAVLEQTSSTQDTYDTDSFIRRVAITTKTNLMIQIPMGFEDSTWHLWDKSSDSLASAVDTKPPAASSAASYDKPTSLGKVKLIKPFYEQTKGKAIYEVVGKGAMNCGVWHYFFSIKDKVIHIPATLCERDGEWKPAEKQAYKDVVTEPIKDFYKYIKD